MEDDRHDAAGGDRVDDHEPAAAHGAPGSTFAGSVVSFASDEAAGAVEVAPRIWWVGRVLDDPFQSHPYLIEAGDQSVLIDPGSTLTIDETLRKVSEVVDLDQLRTIVIHHSDPDVADGVHRLGERLRRDDLRIVTEWRSELLLKHYVPPFPVVTIEDLGWSIEIDEERRLEFALTPYLHFPGAFVSFERSTATLFSSDLFGGFNRAGRLWATSLDDFEDLRQFHEHYMPSRDILMAGLATIQRHFRPIRTICPQHGYVIPQPLVEPMLDELARLECGVMLFSRSDEHLARLVEVAGVSRRLGQVIEHAISIPSTLAVARAELSKLLPVETIALELSGTPRTIDPEGDGHKGTVLRFELDGPERGRNVAERTTPGELDIVETLGRLGDGRTLDVVITLREPAHETQEVIELLLTAGASAIDLVERTTHRLALEHDRESFKVDSRKDPLTNLANRRVLDELLLLAEAMHGDGDGVGVGPSAAIMVDLDHFKMINDRFGHAAGDEVLRRVAAVLEAAVRRGDEVIRYGGEEMLVLARLDREDPAEAVALAERLRARITAMAFDDVTPGHPIWASMGVALFESGHPPSATIELADEAMYQAKHNGRDRVELAPPAQRVVPTIMATPLDALLTPDTDH